jgi:hypothetical protein
LRVRFEFGRLFHLKNDVFMKKLMLIAGFSIMGVFSQSTNTTAQDVYVSDCKGSITAIAHNGIQRIFHDGSAPCYEVTYECSEGGTYKSIECHGTGLLL